MQHQTEHKAAVFLAHTGIMHAFRATAARMANVCCGMGARMVGVFRQGFCEVVHDAKPSLQLASQEEM
jgi:hypothetical protein